MIALNQAGIDKVEFDSLVAEAVEEYRQQGREIASVVAYIDQDGYICIKVEEKSPIRRIRRITGYLSEASNFNEGKQKELQDRAAHMEVENG